MIKSLRNKKEILMVIIGLYISIYFRIIYGKVYHLLLTTSLKMKYKTYLRKTKSCLLVQIHYRVVILYACR